MKEVPITQYIRPNGIKRQVFGNVPDDVALLAENMELSAEVLTTGEVAIYARLAGEPEEAEYMDLASNGPSDNSPDVVLERVIRHVAERGSSGSNN